MSTEQHLQKLKNRGKIDFIEVPLDWGLKYKEFLGYTLESNYFFRIFYDNKYRQDNFTPDIEKYELKLKELELGLKDRGLYNTREEYNQKKKEVDFIKKHLKQ